MIDDYDFNPLIKALLKYKDLNPENHGVHLTIRKEYTGEAVTVTFFGIKGEYLLNFTNEFQTYSKEFIEDFINYISEKEKEDVSRD